MAFWCPPPQPLPASLVYIRQWCVGCSDSLTTRRVKPFLKPANRKLHADWHHKPEKKTEQGREKDAAEGALRNRPHQTKKFHKTLYTEFDPSYNWVWVKTTIIDLMMTDERGFQRKNHRFSESDYCTNFYGQNKHCYIHVDSVSQSVPKLSSLGKILVRFYTGHNP